MGTYFPFAGGEVNADGTPVVDGNGKAVRDLQMTTIDPHDFYQESLKVDLIIPGTPVIKDFRDFNEPQVKVWNNITFADNYYQTVADPNGFTWTPNGRSIDGADINIQLDGRTGFTSDDRRGGPHGNVFSWYAGTADLAIDEVDNGYTQTARPVYDQLGERSLEKLLDPKGNNVTLTPWYSSSGNQGSTEGIGTGWFYSVLGGGKDLRPTVKLSQRVAVSDDNTDEDVAKGDFAVPTLFDGNFDAITTKVNSQTIPGWSLHNDKNDTFQLPLVDWTKITSLNEEKRIVVDYRRDTTNGKLLDSNGKLVEELNIKSLKEVLLTNGYTEEENKLKNADQKPVEGFEVNLLLQDLITVGYQVNPFTEILLEKNGLSVVGIDIDLLATDLSILGYTKDANGNLLNGNGNIVINKDALETLRKDAAAIRKSYLQRLGIDSNSPTNYALELRPKDILTHNRFVVPDWGALRFDLHVPVPESSDAQNSVVRVFLDDYELQSSAFQGLLRKDQKKNNNDVDYTDDGYPAVDLRQYKDSLGARSGEGQSNRIGFAKQGFQTFQVDIPNEFRGKVATLKFEVIGGKIVYLDNVFFKSQHLLFGNPQKLISNPNGDYRQEARKDVDTPKFSDDSFIRNDQEPSSAFRTNYLIEKPQYSLSYNDDTRTPNWVSYQLNKSWLGSEDRKQNTFQPDPHLPFGTLKGPAPQDINPANSNYDRGHMTAAADRSRNKQDYYSTFLMTNVLPQPLVQATGKSQWTKLEEYLRYKLVNKHDKELYIVEGRDGQAIDASGNPLLLNNKISVPESIWKVVLVLDHPGQGIYNVTKNTLAFGIYLPNTLDANRKGQDPDDNWEQNFTLNGKTFGLFNVKQLEDITGYNFFSNIPTDIQQAIENRNVTDIRTKINIIEPAPLMAATESELFPFTVGTFFNSPVGHSGIPNQIEMSIDDHTDSPLEVSVNQNSIFKIAYGSTDENSASRIHLAQIGSSQISPIQSSPTQIGGEQIGTSQNRFYQPSLAQISPEQIGSSQISPTQIDLFKISSPQVNTPQISTFESSNLTINPISFAHFANNANQLNPIKVTLPSFITLQQFISSNSPNHNLTSNLFSDLKYSASDLWQTLFNPANPFDLTLQITDLPTGQLAEAQITQFDSFGRPNGGTLLIDDDANGVGWFIDPTPLDNSEFTQTLTDTAFRATTGDAFGKYDLLTTILHETGHLLGIINGNPGFDSNVQTLNGKKVFVGKDFTAKLSPDGSHLDTAVHPYDLMNNTLAPGVRKLPSLLNLQIINAIRGINTAIPQRPTNPSPQPFFLPVTSTNWKSTSYQPITPSTSTSLAPLRAILLADITNGNFNESDTTKPEYGWSTRGAATILNSQAVLTEDSPLLSNFSQSFIIPERAKYLQFTMKNTTLGANTPTAPGDAFEVALLNANTKQSLVNTSQGLSQTDSLLNIQNDGTYYTSNKVTLVNTTPNSTLSLNQPLTFKVDLTGIQAGTAATLYFDLLGFGARDAKVILDNVMLLDNDFIAPVANNDTATTNQTQPVTINLLANDSDTDSSINPTTLTIQTNPSNGAIALNLDGTVTYTPNPTFVGTDTFTYTITDTDGLTSNTATVNITVKNIAPIITVITGDTTTTEGTTANFSATAVDPGDELTYLWNFGDGSQLLEGQNVTHAYADNGIYIATLTVVDSQRVNSFQSLEITVNNAAPKANAGADQSINEGQSVTFNGNFIDPGILDTHTYTWDFGDGDTVNGTLSPTHIYANNGTYTAKLTITDKDGGVSSDSLTVIVNNVAPTITQLTGTTEVAEGTPANFTATAIDPGNDTLTYTWNFGDGSAPVQGFDVSHTFGDNGIYTVTLTVSDSDGASTSQTLLTKVNNVAATVNAGTDQTMYQNESVIFDGQFHDPGILDTHTIEWNFGDGNTVTGVLNPNHIYTLDGEYTVTLTITDNSGAVTNDTMIVTVKKPPTMSVSDISIIEGDNGNKYAVFTANLSEASQRTITANYSTTDGTATFGSDYTAANARVLTLGVLR